MCGEAKRAAAYFLREYHEREGSDLQFEESGLTPLKLQKLLYYAQGLHLALFNAPLFSDSISAWQHGPVVEAVYRDFAKEGGGVLGLYENNEELVRQLSNREERLLSLILLTYGRYDAWTLSDMTHREEPWQTARSDALPAIDPDEMQSFFKKVIADSDNFALQHSSNDEEFEDISDCLEILKPDADPNLE